MAKEQIGKLERWILIHAYLKGKGELPAAWEEVEGADTWKGRPGLDERREKKLVGLRRDEVYLNYFGVTSFGPQRGIRGDHFLKDKKSQTARVSYGRTLKRMVGKGLIRVLSYSWYTGEPREEIEYFHGKHGITLTEAGEAIAEEALNVSA